MGRQKKKVPNEKKQKSLEKELKEMEENNLSDTEVKVMVITLLNSVKQNIESIQN